MKRLLLALALWPSLALAQQPLIAGVTTNLSTGTQFAIPSAFGTVTVSADSLNYPPSPAAGAIDHLYIQIGAAPGGTATRQFKLRVNNVDTALTCTISDPATTCNDTAHSVSISIGDVLSLSSIGTTSPVATTGSWSSRFTPTVSNETIVLGRTVANGGTSFAPIPQNSATNWTGTQATAQMLVGAAGTFSNMYYSSDQAPGAGVTYTYTVDKNNAAQALTCAVTGAGSGPGITTCNDTTHSFSAVATDTIDIGMTEGGSGASINTGFGLKFVPTTPGQFYFSSRPTTADSATLSRFLAPNGKFPIGTTEPVTQAVAPMNFYLTNMYVKTTDPAGGTSRTFTLRKNGIDTALSCTVSSGSTACSDTEVSGVSFAPGDLFAVSDTPSGSAATGTPMVAFAGQATNPAATASGQFFMMGGL